MTQPLCVMVRPWGGKIGDPINFDQFKRRVMAAGFTVLDVKWNECGSAIRNIRTLMLGSGSSQMMLDATHARQLHMIGVSCGANALAYLQNELRKLGMHVSYAAAVQPSSWCQSYWMGKVPDNVHEELVIYGDAIKTLGFGNYKPQCVQMPVLEAGAKSLYDGKKRMANGGKTLISWRFVDDLHPADWDIKGVQDPILQDMLRIAHGMVAADLADASMKLMMRNQ